MYQYIMEAIEHDEDGVETNSNGERYNELEKYLKGKEYGDYIKTLNSMLEDDKTKALLIDGFGGDLGDLKLLFKETSIKVTALSPTQSEIDIQKSMNYAFAFPENVDNYFKSGPITIKTPLITFKGEFIIDGHHRWSQVFAFNPNASMNVFDYSSKEINSIQMLKAVQGAIAAVKADKNNNNGKLPIEEVHGPNVYKFNKDDIKAYIIKVLNGEELCMKMKDKEIYIEDKGADFIKHLEKYVDVVKKAEGLKAKVEAAADYIASNFEELKSNHSPVQGAPDRGEMPQTDQSSPDGQKADTYGPNDEGSALNKLKDDKIASKAVK